MGGRNWKLSNEKWNQLVHSLGLPGNAAITGLRRKRDELSQHMDAVEIGSSGNGYGYNLEGYLHWYISRYNEYFQEERPTWLFKLSFDGAEYEKKRKKKGIIGGFEFCDDPRRFKSPDRVYELQKSITFLHTNPLQVGDRIFKIEFLLVLDMEAVCHLTGVYKTFKSRSNSKCPWCSKAEMHGAKRG